MPDVARLFPVTTTSAASSSAGGEEQSQPGELTSAEIATRTAALLAEVDAMLSSDRWAILHRDQLSNHSVWLLYDAAALRHCCKLLSEIEVAAQLEQELTVRILGRVHLEAWLTALYLHFGEDAALTRIAEDTLDQLQKTDQEAKQLDVGLATETKSAKKRLVKVKKANEGIAHWNETNSDKSPKAFHKEPYVPQRRKTGLDLSSRIVDFDGYQAQALPVSELVDALTKLSVEKGFGQESFRPIYLIYRFLSAGASHPTLHVYDSYFVPPRAPGGFIRTAPMPLGLSQIDAVRATTLYGTAYLANHVLGQLNCETPVADSILTRLYPDPAKGAGWFPSS